MGIFDRTGPKKEYKPQDVRVVAIISFALWIKARSAARNDGMMFRPWMAKIVKEAVEKRERVGSDK